MPLRIELQIDRGSGLQGAWILEQHVLSCQHDIGILHGSIPEQEFTACCDRAAVQQAVDFFQSDSIPGQGGSQVQIATATGIPSTASLPRSTSRMPDTFRVHSVPVKFAIEAH